MQKQTTTISSAFVFLKPKNSSKSPTKRVLLPKSLTSLINQANKLFEIPNGIKSIISSNGKTIRTIEEVIPGETYYLSNMNPSFIPTPPISEPFSIPLSSKTRSIYLGDDNNMIEDDGSALYSSNLFFATPKKEIIIEEEEEIADNEYEEDCNVIDVDNTSKIRKVEDIFEEFGLDSSKYWADAEKGLCRNGRNIIDNYGEFEMEQINRWYQFGIKIGPISPNNSIEFNHVRTEITSALLQQTFTKNGKDVLLRIRQAIIGPQNSGKSDLLLHAYRMLLLHLIHTGFWKKSFIIYIDFKELANNSEDSLYLYQYIVEKTIDSLEWCFPNILTYSHLLRKHMISLVLNRSFPPIPSFFIQNSVFKAFYDSYLNISKLIYMSWNDSNGYVEWLSLMLALPSLISEAFNFPKTFYICDHVDTFDIRLNSPDHFTRTCVFVIPIIQHILSANDYIISCERQSRFFNIFGYNFREYDPTSLCLYLSTIGVTKESKYYKPVYITMEGYTTPLSLSYESFYGIPRYLVLWESLNALFDIDEQDEEIVSQEEVLSKNIISALYQMKDKDEPKIISVKRSI